MRRTRLPTLALSAALAATVLAGCSDDGDGGASDPTSESTPATTDTEPAETESTTEATPDEPPEPDNVREQELITLAEPAEGATVSGSFTASGMANSFEANVPWQIVDADGAIVHEGFATADGWMGEELFPWETEVDVSVLGPGTYRFEASTDDPSDGEGRPAETVAATIVVE